MKTQELGRHVRSIARKQKISIRKYRRCPGDPPGLQGYSDGEERYIEISPIRSRISYVIAMHELGHILGPWQRGTRLEQEAGAWKWARENCLQWGKSEEKTMHKGMFSHLSAALEETLSLFKKPVKIPDNGHYFWQCLPPMHKAPSWLSDRLFTTPWRDVLDHPERPRCATCRFWQPHHAENGNTGRQWGTCQNPKHPMGVRPLTPDSAVCGVFFKPI